ncbi:hypothetical protein ACTXT7_005805 [Hymenolepis weldensis]
MISTCKVYVISSRSEIQRINRTASTELQNPQVDCCSKRCQSYPIDVIVVWGLTAEEVSMPTTKSHEYNADTDVLPLLVSMSEG